jgi:hypothetical protein
MINLDKETVATSRIADLPDVLKEAGVSKVVLSHAHQDGSIAWVGVVATNATAQAIYEFLQELDSLTAAKTETVYVNKGAIAEDEECPLCLGRRYMDDDDCPECHGAGTVPQVIDDGGFYWLSDRQLAENERRDR